MNRVHSMINIVWANSKQNTPLLIHFSIINQYLCIYLFHFWWGQRALLPKIFKNCKDIQAKFWWGRGDSIITHPASPPTAPLLPSLVYNVQPAVQLYECFKFFCWTSLRNYEVADRAHRPIWQFSSIWEFGPPSDFFLIFSAAWPWYVSHQSLQLYSQIDL